MIVLDRVVVNFVLVIDLFLWEALPFLCWQDFAPVKKLRREELFWDSELILRINLELCRELFWDLRVPIEVTSYGNHRFAWCTFF